MRYRRRHCRPVNLEVVYGLGREGVEGGGPQRVLAVEKITSGRVHVYDQDRPASVFRLGEGIQIGEVQPGVPMGEPPVGTGVMVRHGIFSSCSKSIIKSN